MLAILILTLAFCIFMVKKINNTYENQCVVLDAVYEFLRDEYRTSGKIRYDLVNYDDIEDLYRTIWRLTDWSYENILPPEKLKLIEPYILPYEETKKRMKERGN